MEINSFHNDIVVFKMHTYAFVASRSFVISVTLAHVRRDARTLYTRFVAHGTTVRSIGRYVVTFTTFFDNLIFVYHLNIVEFMSLDFVFIVIIIIIVRVYLVNI